ncbi:hypothetical protein L873DRAFT_272580 [Choiromyces venosus 120613-1]|uniref:Fucose-specific lectin n=1 Tax=Choiromyces venosus 120613-1 TaxID=1336337 RepID=A0A3N4JXI7_9PEZI|nr:hypothetical protein L873DRAFT_272580 [Choiromyces venosus 120613-1]
MGYGEHAEQHPFPTSLPPSRAAALLVRISRIEKTITGSSTRSPTLPSVSILCKIAANGSSSQLLYGPGAYITCASYGRDDHRVFTIDRDNKLCVTEFNTGGNAWSQTKQLTDTIPSPPAAAVPVSGNGPWVRVYVQSAAGQITEWGTNDGKNYQEMRNPLPTH